MSQHTDKEVTLGKITGVFGVKGWVKVYSYTEPMEGILKYQPWYLELNGQKVEVEVENGQRHGKGLIAKLAKYDDRDQSAKFSANQFCYGKTGVVGPRCLMLKELEQTGKFDHRG